MLTPFDTEIWLADRPQVTAIAGFHYPTRMAVIRLPDGGLLIWSPVHLDDALRAEVTALGPVRHIVAPNTLHHLFVAEWAAAFPDARLHAAPGLGEAREDIAFDAELDDTPDAAWAGALDQAVVRGNSITTEVVFFHTASATVLVTDLIQHLPSDWYSGWRKWVARWDRMTGPEPAMPRKFRWSFKDKPAARAAAQRILAWPAKNLVIAHGEPVKGEAARLLEDAFGWL